MLQRFAIWVVCLGLAGTGEAVCQIPSTVFSVVRGKEVTTTNRVVDHYGQGQALPDAPSAAVDRQTFQSDFAGEKPLEPVAYAPPPSFAMVYETVPAQKEPGDFLSKFLVASFRNQDSRYRTSSNQRWMGRATDAASSIFVTRDESGNRRLNTSYFVAVLTSVAAHSASRPYWARSASEPLGDFGSTVGNDAGMHLLHEFGPGLRQAVTGHMPSFVFKIEQRVAGQRNPRQAASNSFQ